MANQPRNPLRLHSVHCISIHLYKVSLYFSERDWEDIRKMPEHGTLQKDFRKAKYEFPPQTLCLLDSLSPIGKSGKYQNYSFRFGWCLIRVMWLLLCAVPLTTSLILCTICMCNGSAPHNFTYIAIVVYANKYSKQAENINNNNKTKKNQNKTKDDANVRFTWGTAQTAG